MLEELGIFTRGLMIGVMVAAPVGPVGLLCIRRTIQKGLWIGFASGFGAAFADALFSAIAAFGLTAIVSLIKAYNDPLYVLGGLLLLFIAWHTWHDKPKQPHVQEVEKRYLKRFNKRFHLGGALKAMATSFVITITNPGTIFGVIAVVATFSGIKESAEAPVVIGGIFVGSSCWWLMLSGGVSLVRKKFTNKRIRLLNKVTGVILALIALWVVGVGVLGLIK